MDVGFAVILCLAAIGSLYWVVPSRRDKNLALLRSCAMQQGLRVRLLDQSLMQHYFKWLKDHRGWVLYELHTPLTTKNSEAFKPFALRLGPQEQMSDDEAQAMLQQHFLALEWPPNAEALLFHTGGVSLLWNERFDVPSELKNTEVAALMLRVKESLNKSAIRMIAGKPWLQ